MEEILSKQKERDAPGSEKEPVTLQQPISSDNKGKSDSAIYETGRDTGTVETKAARPRESAENAPKSDKGISGVSRKRSVLNALRERQARKAQEKEKQGQEKTARKKGEQEL